jgi:thioesterase domain-containing protein
MSPLISEQSFLLGGYSFGGNAALEMALQFQQSGIDVNDLDLFDGDPPHAYNAVTTDEPALGRPFR